MISLSCFDGFPKFVWLEGIGPSRNQFVRFDRTVVLSMVPEAFPLHVFADTRYRLRVNGEFVASGPGRFVTQFPEYDTHDLVRWLRAGENRIEVEVNFFGASSFQSMPDGRPGFIAWGGSAGVDLATPGEWTGWKLDAWAADAPLFSFAQNPVEICDTRRLVSGAEKKPLVVLGGEAAPWGPLHPYSGVAPSFEIQNFHRIELAGALKSDERRVGFLSHDPEAATRPNSGTKRPWRAFATWIHAQTALDLRVSCFWSELRCNGEAVPVDTNTPLGNHGYCVLPLRGGWNLLTGEFEVLSENWVYCLGVPSDAPVSLHGRRDLACDQPLVLSAIGPRESLGTIAETAEVPPADWTLCDGDPSKLTPARMMGWDEPVADAVRGLASGALHEVSTIEAAEATWCVSFLGGFLGHPIVEVDAPEGTILDVAVDDWQAPSGGAAPYLSNPFVDSAERFVLKGGPQTVELFHCRGGRFLQATLRSPSGPAPLTLRRVAVRSRRTLGPDGTRFRCDHPALEWSWAASMRTLIASTEDAYSDSPWRERGTYIGDLRVNLFLQNLLTGDLHTTARRAIRVFAQAQFPDGLLPAVAPAWLRHPLEDFTLLWISIVEDYHAMTGDLETVAEMWPTIEAIWSSTAWKCGDHGLWDKEGPGLFIDWGVLNSEREGRANALLNLFRLRAARSTAALAALLGRDCDATFFEAEAARVDAAIGDMLWSDERGTLLPALGATTPGLHANALALAFAWGTHDQRQRILRAIEPALRSNLARGIKNGQGSGHLELFIFHFLLPALADLGRPDLAEELIAQHYGYLQGLGLETLPECFSGVERNVGSLCHSWVGAPAIYAARYVLGLRPAAGNPDRLVFSPVVHGITRASGKIAHRRGWIEVDWKRVNGRIDADIHAPEGVEIVNNISQTVCDSPGVQCEA